MASTRSRNTPGNYCLEQWSNGKNSSYNTYVPYAFAETTLLAGDGLMSGRIPETELSGNSKDIESFLFGIGSTNLVQPKEPVKPDLKQLNELNLIDRRVPLLMPKKLTVQNDQRQYHMK